MSATLAARDLAAGHGDRPLFSGLDLTVGPGDVIGLVGANGAGKSTLLRILAGEVAPEGGAVTRNPPASTVGYLPQEPAPTADESVADYLGRRTGVEAAQIALDSSLEALTADSPGADDVYAAALERWLALGAADLPERAEQVLGELGLVITAETPMTELSGGQAARVGMASLLLSRYDVFLLDEPTNNLDLDGLDRLERFITDLRAGVVLVSHDREFLARTVGRVVELDLAQQQVNIYGGGYAGYLHEREVARMHARQAYEEYADTKSDLLARARKQRAWSDKGVANATKKQTDPDKILKAARIEGSENLAAKARQTERALERLEVVEEPRKEWDLRIEIAAAPRSGQVVSTLRDATVQRGDFTLGPVNLHLSYADRVAITGPNGAGKTTLLSLIIGDLAPDVGSASLGSGVIVGHVDQARAEFDSSDHLLESFRRAVPDLPPADCRTLLAKFGLRADHVLRPADTLSPGERTRAGLAVLQARGINLLVLDEPTNHLDLPAIEQLESALSTFAGTLLLVSHDRRLLEAVDTSRNLAVQDGQVAEG